MCLVRERCRLLSRKTCGDVGFDGGGVAALTGLAGRLVPLWSSGPLTRPVTGFLAPWGAAAAIAEAATSPRGACQPSTSLKNIRVAADQAARQYANSDKCAIYNAVWGECHSFDLSMF